jgi:hypothetical protein
MPGQILTNACVLNALFRLTVNVRRINSGVQNRDGKKMPAGEVPNPEDVPGIYCSTGKARCQDLNFERQCICGSCEVWKEYDIKDVDPNNYFYQHVRAV